MYCKILIIISIAKILILCLCLCCRYIGHHVKKMIERIGPESVMAVAFDGGADWQSTKELIQAEWPWICFLYCISHGVSLVIKDCFDEDSGIDKLIQTNNWISDCQKWFSTHACTAFRKVQAEPGEKVSFVRPAPTRYGRVLLQWKQFLEMKPLLRRVVESGVYQEKFCGRRVRGLHYRNRSVDRDRACRRDDGAVALIDSPGGWTKTRHFKVVRHDVIRS